MASAPAERTARRSISFAKEMLTTMGLCGVNTIAEIDDNLLAV